MRPKRLAQLICANSKAGGICAGVMINPDLSQYIDEELAGKPCRVNGKRCCYFERIIIPQVLRHTHKDHPQLQQMKGAVASYETMVMKLKIDIRRCRQCGKPSPGMKANEKYCANCKRLRILKSKRKWKSKRKIEAEVEKVHMVSEAL